jgi:hypothetical protein
MLMQKKRPVTRLMLQMIKPRDLKIGWLMKYTTLLGLVWTGRQLLLLCMTPVLLLLQVDRLCNLIESASSGYRRVSIFNLLVQWLRVMDKSLFLVFDIWRFNNLLKRLILHLVELLRGDIGLAFPMLHFYQSSQPRRWGMLLRLVGGERVRDLRVRWLEYLSYFRRRDQT